MCHEEYEHLIRPISHLHTVTQTVASIQNYWGRAPERGANAGASRGEGDKESDEGVPSLVWGPGIAPQNFHILHANLCILKLLESFVYFSGKVLTPVFFIVPPPLIASLDTKA